MPPNSKYDRFDRHSPKQTISTELDSQIKKNCKFRNFPSSEIFNYNCNESIHRRSEYPNRFENKNQGSIVSTTHLKSPSENFASPTTKAFNSEMKKTKMESTPAFEKCKSFASTCLPTSVSSTYALYAFVTLSSIFVYLPCLYNEFVFDDKPAIVHNKIVQQSTPFTNFYHLFTTDYWGTPIQKQQSHKSYRPFTVFTFRLNFWFGKLDPTAYQLINIILHCLVSLLNYRFIAHFLRKESAFIAAILFAIHPIHVDAVASVVGRAELLCSLFILTILNLRLVIKKPINLPVLFILTLFSLLSKEQGITVLPVLIVYETLLGGNEQYSCKCVHRKCDKMTDKSTRQPIDKSKDKTNEKMNNERIHCYSNLLRRTINSTYNCKLFTMFICILFARCHLLHDLPKFSRFDNPLDSFSSPYKQFNCLYIWLFNVYKFLNPYQLACDWSAQSIELITSASIFIIPLLIVTAILLYIIHHTILHNNLRLLFLIAFPIITFLPASNLFFTVGFLFAERILYLPLSGLCAIVAYSYQNLLNLSKSQTILRNSGKSKSSISLKSSINLNNFLRLLMVAICLMNAYRSWLRTFDWRSEHTLYTKDLQTNPKNIKLLNNLGKLYEQENDYERAFDYYLKAIEIQPDDSRGSLNCANLHSKLGNYQQAEHYYRRAIQTMPVRIDLNDGANRGRKNLSFYNNYKFDRRLKVHNALTNNEANDFSDGSMKSRQMVNINLNNDEQSKTIFNKNVHHLRHTDTLELSVSTVQMRAALNLANLLSNNPLKASEANRIYEQLIAIKPDHGPTYLSAVESILRSNSSDLRTIRHVLVQLLHNNVDVNVLYNVAVLISNSGNSMMALQLFDQILKLDPKHEEALLTSARIIRKNSEFNQLHQVAIERMEKFVSLNQLDHSVFFELGMLYINFNIQKSIEYLQKAIQIKPDFSQALFNLALLLYKQHRAQEAIPFLELLIKKDESHQKAMILLFAINSSNQQN